MSYVRHVHVEDILDKLEADFSYHYENIFHDGKILHLHKAEAIKAIADWVVYDSVADVTEEQKDMTDGWWDDLRRMKDYLYVNKLREVPLQCNCLDATVLCYVQASGGEVILGRRLL